VLQSRGGTKATSGDIRRQDQEGSAHATDVARAAQTHRNYIGVRARRPGRHRAFKRSGKRIEGLGTKTEALLVSEPSIIEIDELRPLIAEGQEKGFLTVEQITTCLEEVDVTKEQIADLHHYFEEQGID